MFAADLSWTEPATEKVGERRERKAKECSNSSATPSLQSSRSSISDDRQLFWPSSLKKAKSVKPDQKPKPSTNRKAGHARKLSSSNSVPPPPELDRSLRDPILQPAWTYSASLSSTLPSGAPLDLPVYEVPELEGDLSSRRTTSSGSRSSHERPWGWKSPGKIKVIDEVHEVQQLSPRSFIARTTRRSSEAVEADLDLSPQSLRSSSPKDDAKASYSVKIEGCLDLEALKMQDQPEEIAPPAIEDKPSYANSLSNLVAWRPPSNWEVILPPEHSESNETREPCERPQQKELPPLPTGVANAHSSLLELTRFQRFIRRMESAGPKVILDRLKEEWHDPTDEETNEELALEKSLWVLTAFQLQNLGRSKEPPRPRCNTGKILELYGDLSELYQLSAMHPSQKVHYLTTRPQQSIPLPGNVAYLTVSQAGLVPIPYHDLTFSHIRASTLPSLVPSSKLPQLFRECYRLLAPGGMLEIRIMDASPVRKTAGPKMKAWIEDRLSLNLERLFRCSKPCMLVSSWLTDAGFDLPKNQAQSGEQNMKLPCACEKENSNVDVELSTLIGRAIWQEIWGGFVDDVPGEPRWWWEDEEFYTPTFVWWHSDYPARYHDLPVISYYTGSMTPVICASLVLLEEQLYLTVHRMSVNAVVGPPDCVSKTAYLKLAST
ncbi:uncharacterized protein BDR25DRAFT_347392 [Lindgomyces ingoldianus]|uniref:Uncharacterized protein n=1 Tax=Lindgomyces ingoldianus TaxID=673940 RepID=A0ACB6QAK2_9PLEO|nr:uncharacterized protein BDR25DRAFT_347392 [Lindgomyces ingoldianus]KAF2463176.1 hypothetical protein BDR25DRAFT_347392 [Lindgomyces ingoldianus]